MHATTKLRSGPDLQSKNKHKRPCPRNEVSSLRKAETMMLQPRRLLSPKGACQSLRLTVTRANQTLTSAELEVLEAASAWGYW